MIKDLMLDRPIKTVSPNETEGDIPPSLAPDCADDEHAVDEELLSAFLAQLEPQAPPPGLVESIEALTTQSQAAREQKQPSLAWEGARWAVEGPLFGLRTLAIPTFGTEQAWQGVSTLRFALGPLLSERPRPEPKRSWWLRQAVRLWR
jgi:hypothetical protein